MEREQSPLPYLYVVTGNLMFALSAVVFARYARSHGVLWLNTAKSLVSLVSAFVFLTLLGQWTQPPSAAVWPFFASGLVGLGLGDVFLISAFARIGSARTMVLWGFQPVFVAIGSYFLFRETVNPTRLAAIGLLISCLLTFSFEGFKKHGRWEWLGLLCASAGVLLDAVGMFFSRHGFDATTVTPMEGHFYRCAGAVTTFVLLKIFFPFDFFGRVAKLPSAQLRVLFLACFAGTFLSIFLSLSAIQIGNLPSIAALSITTPLFTSMFEHLYHRQWPGRIFLFAFAQFLVGFFLLVGYR